MSLKVLWYGSTAESRGTSAASAGLGPLEASSLLPVNETSTSGSSVPSNTGPRGVDGILARAPCCWKYGFPQYTTRHLSPRASHCKELTKIFRLIEADREFRRRIWYIYSSPAPLAPYPTRELHAAADYCAGPAKCCDGSNETTLCNEDTNRVLEDAWRFYGNAETISGHDHPTCSTMPMFCGETGEIARGLGDQRTVKLIHPNVAAA